MAEQNSGIFRQKALERITTPEQLTDYLRVTSPGIWTLFAAIIILLGGLLVWSTVGTLETFADGVAEIKDNQAVIMVTENAGNEIASGMTVRQRALSRLVWRISTNPLQELRLTSFPAKTSSQAARERVHLNLQKSVLSAQVRQ